MIKHTDLETAAIAFEESLKRNLIDTDSVIAIYNRITSGMEDIKLINLPQNLPELKPYNPDAKVYDLLLKGGMEK